MANPVRLSAASQSVIRADIRERSDTVDLRFWDSFGSLSASHKFCRVLLAVITLGISELVNYCNDLFTQWRVDRSRPRMTITKGSGPWMKASSGVEESIKIPTRASWIAGAGSRRAIANYLNSVITKDDFKKMLMSFRADSTRSDYKLGEAPNQPLRTLNFTTPSAPGVKDIFSEKNAELLRFVQSHLPTEILLRSNSPCKMAEAHATPLEISHTDTLTPNFPTELTPEHCRDVLVTMMHQSGLGGALILSDIPDEEAPIIVGAGKHSTIPGKKGSTYSLLKGDKPGVFLIECELDSIKEACLFRKTSLILENEFGRRPYKEFHGKQNILIRVDFNRGTPMLECLKASCEYTIFDIEIGNKIRHQHSVFGIKLLLQDPKLGDPNWTASCEQAFHYLEHAEKQLKNELKSIKNPASDPRTARLKDFRDLGEKLIALRVLENASPIEREEPRRRAPDKKLEKQS